MADLPWDEWSCWRSHHHLRLFIQELSVGFKTQDAVVANRNVTKFAARAFRQLLPGNKIRVMFHLGQDDLIIGPDARITQATMAS